MFKVGEIVKMKSTWPGASTIFRGIRVMVTSIPRSGRPYCRGTVVACTGSFNVGDQNFTFNYAAMELDTPLSPFEAKVQDYIARELYGV